MRKEWSLKVGAERAMGWEWRLRAENEGWVESREWRLG